MEKSTLETNLKTVKEMVLDENKLVTYVSISKDLCIHVNEGKSLLSHLLEDLRKNHPNIRVYVTYIISGLLSDKNASTKLCSESDINSLRTSFKTIFYEHVYSVSQGLKSVNNVALALVNKFEDLTLCTGLIKNSYCSKRSHNEIGILKSNSQVNIVEEKTAESKNTKKPIKKDDDVKKLSETKSEPTVKMEISSPAKDTISNGKNVTKKNGKAGTKNITGFFNKANSVPIIKPSKESAKDIKLDTPKVDLKIKTEKIESNNTNKDIESKTKKSANIGTKDKSPKESNVDKPKKNNSLTEIKKNAKVDKKRKRVLHVSDSESDNDTNNAFADEKAEKEESEDEIPPTPTVSTVKITSGMVNPKKRRKVVDKTYTDDEGYILTKKVEVYESCSDSEEVATKENNNDVGNKNEEKKSPPSNEKVVQIKSEVSPKKKGGKKKVSPPQKGKQTTMMSFFKKA